MIVVVATLCGVASVKLVGGRLRALAGLELYRVSLIWIALITQTLVVEVLGSVIAAPIARSVHVAGYALAFGFLWLNRRVPGVPLIALGAGCNVAAIVANEGVMPASAGAWSRAGLAVADGAGFENSSVLDDAHLLVLGDVFAIPQGWPLANVFSIGDVLIVVGATYLAHRCCWPQRAGASSDATHEFA